MGMEQEYIGLVISFQLPQSASKEVIAISQRLGAKYNSKFILDGKLFYPHITVYPPKYPLKYF